MSPEQLTDVRSVDARADVWSLGATFYEVLTGAAAFPAESLAQLHVKILTAPPRAPSELRPDLPLELEEVVLRCLERDRALRYASMMDLYRALEALSATLVEVPRPLFDSAPSNGSPRVSIAPREAFAATALGAEDSVAAVRFDDTDMPTSQTFAGARSASTARKPRAARVAAVAAGITLACGLGWAALQPAKTAPMSAAARGTVAGAPSVRAPEPIPSADRAPSTPASTTHDEVATAEPKASPPSSEPPPASARSAPRSSARGATPPAPDRANTPEPKPEAPKSKKRGSVLNPEFDE
jgi:serine/threonine-protein kinase